MHDVSEFGLCIVVHVSASPFAISNAMRRMWPILNAIWMGQIAEYPLIHQVPSGADTALTPHVAAPTPARETEWRGKQRCCCCERRRTCRIDPESSNGWICKHCLAIPASETA
jgi:hypothetical protein